VGCEGWIKSAIDATGCRVIPLRGGRGGLPVRAVVAGATGFLGGYLLEALIASGVEPVALVREGSDHRLVNRLGVEKRSGDG
jgi:hypothetical protein